MSEIAIDEIQTFPLDHHGIIAAVCKDLQIAERIDGFLGVHEKRIVTPGQAVVAMIINGLGFTNRRLYLTHQFFASKPVGQLLDADIKATDLSDYTLGHTLDEIADYGVTDLFAKVAFGIAVDHNLLGRLNHLDTTTFSVTGQYESDSPETIEDNGEPIEINITHGHSKDHRPDLKQVVLSLVVNGPSSMPLWMEALDGNSSDKTSFHETIKKMNKFKKQININDASKWVADSALYSTSKLLSSNDYLWLTRVPETLGEARALVSQREDEINWQDRVQKEVDGYRWSALRSSHGGIPQRWLLVFSEHAYVREKKTLDKKLAAAEKDLVNEIWHLGAKEFGCAQDAENAAMAIRNANPLYHFMGQIIPVEKYKNPGKPKAGETPEVRGYKVNLVLERNEEEVEKILRRKGRFILATNDMDEVSFTDEQMLREYKEQQKVEGGFRFLKDPWFMVDSVFLKSARRISALMMVMTLCLLVYNYGQYWLRKKLKEENETLPNQLDKEVQNPTMRWIFQIMEGVGMARIYGQGVDVPMREVVTNLTDVRRKIIRLFGGTACKIYGLTQKNALGGLGM